MHPATDNDQVKMRQLARRLIGHFVIAAVLIGFVLPLLAPAHSIWETDRDCGPVLTSQDHQTTHFESVVPPVTEEHCALCHWLRSIGGAAPRSTMVAVPGFEVRTASAAPQDQCPQAGPAPQQPSRAPPTSL
jgi:hypothetical protein